MDLQVWEWEGGSVSDDVPEEHWMSKCRADLIRAACKPSILWTLDDLRERAKMEADKVSGVEPPPLIKDKDGNMRDKDGNKVRTAQEERELQRGKACGGLCGRTFLCNCTSTKWLVPRQMWVCEGCWNDYQRLWGKS